jgi:hypothetical protein
MACHYFSGKAFDMNLGKVLKTGRPRLGMCVVGVPVLAATGLFVWTGMSFATAEAAAGKRAVLEIEVKIEAGRERWKNGSEWKEGAFSQSYTLNIPYVAAAELDNINPYDPDYTTKALQQATKAQAQATRIARQGGSQSANPFNTVLDPSTMMQVDPGRMADLAKRSQACNNDQACLMQLGMEMMSQNATGQDAATLQKVQQISTECSQTVGMRDRQKFDACMQEKGGKYAMTADGTDLPDTGPGFAEPAPDRFQRWEMAGSCGATVVADYKYEAHEKLNDVSGPAEGSETTIGASEGAVIPSQMPMTCSNNQIITDVKTRKMYIQSFYMPMIPVHHSIKSKLLGKSLEEDMTSGLPGGTDMPTQKTVTQWITEQLKNAPLSDHAERAFKIKGNMNGISRVTNATGTQEIVPSATDPYAWKRQAPNFHETEFLVKVTWRLKELR